MIPEPSLAPEDLECAFCGDRADTLNAFGLCPDCVDAYEARTVEPDEEDAP
jgi:hypothetical protein